MVITNPILIVKEHRNIIPQDWKIQKEVSEFLFLKPCFVKREKDWTLVKARVIFSERLLLSYPDYRSSFAVPLVKAVKSTDY